MSTHTSISNQTFFLVKTLLILKSWRLLFLLPIAAFCVFGVRASHVILLGWMATFLKHRFIAVTARKFFQSNKAYVATSMSQFAKQMTATKMLFRQLNFRATLAHHFSDCTTMDTCFAQMYSSMLLNKDQRQYYYTAYNQSISLCQTDYTSMLDCSFFGHIAALSHYTTRDRKHWYKNYHTFQLVSLPNVTNDSVQHTVCDSEKSFFISLPKMLTFEMTLVTAMTCCYLLIATVTCINELKLRGFLQLMFRRGLSPFSFWAAVWLLTSIELLLLSGSLTVSFYLQCPGFYSPIRIGHTFLIVSTYFFFLAAFVFLLTVVSTDYYAVCKGTFVYIAVSAAFMLAGRLAYETDSSGGSLDVLKIAALILPWANVAEQLQANLGGQVSPEIETNTHIAGLLINGSVLAIMSMATLYLDHVLPTGNGLCYPACYLFQSVPGNQDMPPPNDSSPCVESLDLGVLVRMVDVSRTVQDRIEGSISVDIYEDQITAIVDSDSARSGSLLGVLTGRLPVRDGLVWVDGCLASDPMARPHTHIRLGECPQVDALSHRLSVADTLAILLVACGRSWAESEDEINQVVTLLHLLDKLPCQVATLSAGQKRKLCVALALLGNPRLVVLHEPTRCLDPLSRQRLWRLLQDFRHGRCIVLSTLFADEADLFADYKIFVSADCGLVCAGTSAFIRQSLGCGPVLRAELRHESLGEQVMEALRAKLPSEARPQVQGTALTVALSLRDDHLLAKVVESLRTVSQHITSVGVAPVPLSSVKRKLKEMSPAGVASLFQTSHTSLQDVKPSVVVIEEDTEPQSLNNDDFVIPGQENDPKMDAQTQQAHGPKAIGMKGHRASCPVAAWGIFSLHCCLLRRNWCGLMARILVPGLLLVIHALMLALEKQAVASKSTVWTNFTNLPLKKYSRGFCISDQDIPPNHKMDSNRCSQFYTGATTIGDSFLALYKLKATPLYEFLLQPSLVSKFHEHCSTQTKPDELPCPIVYSTTWYMGTYNMERQLSIGSYSPYRQYKPELTAATTFLVSQGALNYFSQGELTANFKLAAFIDFRSVHMPLYGTFFQVFLLAILPSLYLNDVMDHKVFKWRDYLASMGVSTLGYWASTCLFHWLHYAAVYGVLVILGQAFNPIVYQAKYQLAVAGITVTCGLFNNLLLAYVFSAVLSCSRRVTAIAHMLLSILAGISVIAVQSMDMVSIALIAGLPPFATGSLSFYSVKLHTYMLQLHEHGEQVGLPNIGPEYAHKQRHIRMCLLAIPAQTGALILLLVVAENARGVFQCCCGQGGGSNSSGSRSSARPEEAGDQAAEGVVNGNHPATIELHNMGKTFNAGRRVVEAVRDVSLKVAARQTVAVFGPNGSGVSTALAVVTGRLRATSGRCQVAAGGSRWLAGRRVGYRGLVAHSLQRSRLFATLTADEHLRCYAWMLGAPADRRHQLLRSLDLEHCKDTPACWLADGDKRRLGVAIGLLSSAPLLVIDDASSGIAPDEQAGVWRAIADAASGRMSVLVSAHCFAGAASTALSGGGGGKVALVNQGYLAALLTIEQLRKHHGVYMLEIEIEAQTTERAKLVKAALLKAIVRRFFAVEILDQTTHWLRFAVPQESVEPALESLNWLIRLKAEHRGLADVIFHPASVDEMLEPMLRQHDRQVLKSSAASPGDGAGGLARLPEFYEV